MHIWFIVDTLVFETGSANIPRCPRCSALIYYPYLGGGGILRERSTIEIINNIYMIADSVVVHKHYCFVLDLCVHNFCIIIHTRSLVPRPSHVFQRLKRWKTWEGMGTRLYVSTGITCSHMHTHSLIFTSLNIYTPALSHMHMHTFSSPVMPVSVNGGFKMPSWYVWKKSIISHLS